MRRAIAVLLLALACALPSLAQTQPAACTPKLSYGASGNLWSLDFLGCSSVPAFTPGQPITLMLGTTKFDGTVVKFFPADPNNPLNQSASVVFSVPNNGTSTTDPIQAQYASNTAKVTYDGQSWTPALAEPLNVRTSSYEFGPVTSGSTEGSGQTNTPQSQAFRLQAALASSYRPPAVQSPKASLASRLEKDFTLSIDTTDQQTGFVDDNSAALGLYVPHLAVKDLFVEGRLGGTVTYSKAFHSDTSDLDATAELSGWLPILQSMNLMSSTTQLGSPLSLNLQYGYRRRSESGVSTRGEVAEGTAGYHFYVLDNYRVDLIATTTWSTANTPRTQHWYKAQILYASSPTARFNIVTSVENGSVGPVVQKVRNYFIGVALGQVFEKRAGGNQ